MSRAGTAAPTEESSSTSEEEEPPSSPEPPRPTKRPRRELGSKGMKGGGGGPGLQQHYPSGMALPIRSPCSRPCPSGVQFAQASAPPPLVLDRAIRTHTREARGFL